MIMAIDTAPPPHARSGTFLNHLITPNHSTALLQRPLSESGQRPSCALLALLLTLLLASGIDDERLQILQKRIANCAPQATSLISIITYPAPAPLRAAVAPQVTAPFLKVA